jgi:hypothetical protein
MSFKNYRVRQDSNQSALVKHINKIPGCLWLDLSGVGGGCVDGLIQEYTGGKYRFHLVEIKTEKGKLNKLQREFHAKFHCHIARTVEDIWRLLGYDSRPG